MRILISLALIAAVLLVPTSSYASDPTHLVTSCSFSTPDRYKFTRINVPLTKCPGSKYTVGNNCSGYYQTEVDGFSYIFGGSFSALPNNQFSVSNLVIGGANVLQSTTPLTSPYTSESIGISGVKIDKTSNVSIVGIVSDVVATQPLRQTYLQCLVKLQFPLVPVSKP